MSPSNGERGSALLAAVLILFGLTLMVTTYALLAATESQIAGHDTRASQSLYVAEAGINEALGRLVTAAGANAIGQTGTVTSGWGVYLVETSGNSAQDPARASQASDSLDNNVDGQVDEAGERYPEVLSTETTKLGYPWVRVEYKRNAARQVLYYGDGDHNPMTADAENTTTGAPEYLVTAMGTQGTATRVVQVTAQHVPFPAMPATLYTETTDVTFNGTAFKVSGYDTDPATGDSIPGNATVAGIATTGDPSVIDAGLKPQQTNNVLGSGGSPSVVHSSYDYDMQGYFNSYAAFADIDYTSTQHNPDTAGWGDLNTYHVVEVQGDLHLSGVNTGGGVLLIQGDFDCSGQFTWYGAVIVLGNITLTGGGSGVHIYGAMMAGNGVSTSETYSGNADLMYSSATLNKLNFLGPFRIAGWREQ